MSRLGAYQNKRFYQRQKRFRRYIQTWFEFHGNRPCLFITLTLGLDASFQESLKQLARFWRSYRQRIQRHGNQIISKLTVLGDNGRHWHLCIALANAVPHRDYYPVEDVYKTQDLWPYYSRVSVVYEPQGLCRYLLKQINPYHPRGVQIQSSFADPALILSQIPRSYAEDIYTFFPVAITDRYEHHYTNGKRRGFVFLDHQSGSTWQNVQQETKLPLLETTGAILEPFLPGSG